MGNGRISLKHFETLQSFNFQVLLTRDITDKLNISFCIMEFETGVPK
jgi:hypothetical protein